MVVSGHAVQAVLNNRMQWFERFATEGLAFPACLVAFGSLVILRARSVNIPTNDQLAAVPAWVRWVALRNSKQLQRHYGWVIITSAVVIAILRLR